MFRETNHDVIIMFYAVCYVLVQIPELVTVAVKLLLPHPTQDFIEMLLTNHSLLAT